MLVVLWLGRYAIKAACLYILATINGFQVAQINFRGHPTSLQTTRFDRGHTHSTIVTMCQSDWLNTSYKFFDRTSNMKSYVRVCTVE